MANKTIQIFDAKTQTPYDLRLIDNGDGTYDLATTLDAGAVSIGTVTQGTAGTMAAGWYVRFTDGTNLLGTAAHPVATQQADLTTTAAITAQQANLAATTTATTTSAVVLPISGARASWVATLGTLPAGMTLNFAASFDGGTTWHTVAGTQLGGAGGTAVTASSTTSANNLAAEGNTQVWIGMAGDATHLAVWCSAFASGTASVTLVASAAVRHLVLQGTLQSGAPVALSSPPAATNAGSATALTFASAVNHIDIQNKTAAALYVDYSGGTASVGSHLIAAGAWFFLDVHITAISLYTAAAQNINGTADLNIAVSGEA